MSTSEVCFTRSGSVLLFILLSSSRVYVLLILTPVLLIMKPTLRYDQITVYVGVNQAVFAVYPA